MVNTFKNERSSLSQKKNKIWKNSKLIQEKKPFRRMFWKNFVCNACENSVGILSLDIGRALDFSNHWDGRAEFSNPTV